MPEVRGIAGGLCILAEKNRSNVAQSLYDTFRH